MRVPFTKTAVRITLGIGVLAASGLALLSSDDIPVYTTADKAYYADAETLNYIRPGLKLDILGATIGNDGTIKVRFKLADPKGVPLDRTGVETAGAITTRWVAAYIPKGQTKYVSYSAREVASTLPGNGGKGTQATDDSGYRNEANYQKVGNGEYVYTFATKATNVNRNATHSIGVWADRDLAEFEMTTWQNSDSKVFTFVPDGTEVKDVRDVIKTATCNKCHGSGAGIQAHGTRRTIELCVLCHTPQTVDPDTGHSMDMTVMAHKIHMGAELPSVKAGGKYVIIGYRNAEHDYSHVGFPTESQNCTMCHEQNTGAAQATNFLTKPTRTACGSCHDNVNFATGENHMDMPQLNDNSCARCHEPEGELEFDASIKGAHTIARFSRDIPGVVFDFKEIRDAEAGKKPTVVIRVTDRKGNAITKLNRFSVVMAGPTSDYSSYISEDLSKTAIASDGTVTHTFVNAIPADAKGTFAFGVEGRRDVTLMPGTKQEQTLRDAGKNVVKYASVDGSAIRPRRTVVTLEKCNACHGSLALHGGNRSTIDQCVLCHNPNKNDVSVRPKDQGLPVTVNMAYMVHRIHTGALSDSEYVIYGNGSSRNDFGHIGYPADRRECTMCHVNGSEVPPLEDGMLQVQNPRGILSPMGPTSAACLGCHTETYTASHALSNTTEQLGEACAACHATGRNASVPKAHAR
ncbi:MAG TPA: OmcA/MtrC family decaheme c-type cytochrome [Bryobacteraceae bacterium]|nr:OmcA/MtrC family decaheme c-type cytochrome [Bryobacteraceae bacterium]